MATWEQKAHYLQIKCNIYFPSAKEYRNLSIIPVSMQGQVAFSVDMPDIVVAGLEWADSQGLFQPKPPCESIIL